MLSGNTYFRCISMIFLPVTLFFSLKVHFRFERTLSDMIQSEIRLLDLQNFVGCIFDEKMISQWEHRILSIWACDAIRPAWNCFISMIISVDTLSGFAP